MLWLGHAGTWQPRRYELLPPRQHPSTEEQSLGLGNLAHTARRARSSSARCAQLCLRQCSGPSSEDRGALRGEPWRWGRSSPRWTPAEGGRIIMILPPLSLCCWSKGLVGPMTLQPCPFSWGSDSASESATLGGEG